MESELWEHICTKDELVWLRGHRGAATLGTVLFSAKESIYKAAFPEIRSVLEFGDVEVDIDLDRQCFTGQILHPAGSSLAPLHGHYRELTECIVTVVFVESDR